MEAEEKKKVFVVTDDDGDLIAVFEDEDEAIDYCTMSDFGYQEVYFKPKK